MVGALGVSAGGCMAATATNASPGDVAISTIRVSAEMNRVQGPQGLGANRLLLRGVGRMSILGATTELQHALALIVITIESGRWLRASAPRGRNYFTESITERESSSTCILSYPQPRTFPLKAICLLHILDVHRMLFNVASLCRHYIAWCSITTGWSRSKA
eukprot:2305807-Pleurochrysis_carterae.AAC.2